MKILKFFLVIFVFLPFLVTGQINLIPHTSFYGVVLNRNITQAVNIPVFDNNFGYAYGMGLDVEQILDRKLIVYGGIHASFFSNKTRVYKENLNSAKEAEVSISKRSLSRWDYHAGFKFELSPAFLFRIAAHIIHQPYKAGGAFSSRRPYKVNEFGLSGSLSLSRGRFRGGLFYYYGMKNFNYGVPIYNPFRTIGIELSYPIELKSKQIRSKK